MSQNRKQTMGQREQQAKLLAFLYDRQISPEMEAMHKVIQARLEACKDSLVRCDAATTPKLQGAAQELEKLLRDITQKPLNKEE